MINVASVEERGGSVERVRLEESKAGVGGCWCQEERGLHRDLGEIRKWVATLCKTNIKIAL